ncbi:glycosyltransferase family 4 protein [Enterococcus nangangensis]|uniref:glycosyltransferase family 4 protein n=1 Tax=Enterococcus nangangensis TaxID=2559926 RepID=UPI0010FA20AE|nr:glycosyltransferase family 4 protein [Enterococcus nangangensis]
MKVGLFSDSYFPQVSGVATSMKTLKEALEAEGHEVYIFTTTDPNAKKFEKNIIRMPSVPFVSFKDRRIIVRGMLYAYLVAKELELDLIHTQTEFGAGMLGKMVARQLKIPCVHTYHTMYEDYLHYIANGKLIRPSHVRMLSKFFSKHLAGIVCPSMRVVDTLHKYGVNVPMQIIPTGINLTKFSRPEVKDPKKIQALKESLHLDQGQVILLSLSRLSYEKNIHEVLHGLPAIVAEISQVHLVVAGKGPYREELEALTAELNLTDHVTFVGEVHNDDVPLYYHMADYFVSCSTSESQGLTYTEAMASETPCVVCGNEYIDGLFDHPSLGQTFAEPQDFAATFLQYYQAAVPRDLAILQAKLYPMSAEKFVADILDFYQAAGDYFEVQAHLESKKELKRLKRPKILKRKVKVHHVDKGQ